MNLIEFKQALDNKKDTLLNIELCGKILNFYDNLPEEDKEEYRSNIRYIRICYESYNGIEKNKVLEENNNKLSPDLLKKIDESIKDLTDKEQIAFKIYYELSKYLMYSSKYVMAETEIDMFEELYKDPIDVNSKDREVVCITWVRIFASLLNRYGIDAMVTSRTGLHHSVMFKVGSIIYTADATEMKYSDKSETYMNDLARIKLGIVPRSIDNRYYKSILNHDDYRRYICDVFTSLGLDLREDTFEHTTFEKLNDIYDSGGENFYEVFDVDPNDEMLKSVKKMQIIDLLIKNCDLTNTELMQYVNNLSDVLFSSDRLVDDVTIIDDIKKRISKVFIIGDNKLGYKYFVVEEEGVRDIERDDLATLFKKGDFIINTKKVPQSERREYSIKKWKNHIYGFELDLQENEGDREI